VLAVTDDVTGEREKVGDPVSEYHVDGFYMTGPFERLDPADPREIKEFEIDTWTLYAECTVCGEKGEDIHELLGWDGVIDELD